MRKPRLAIFDFDGTLVDTWDWFAAELASAVEAVRWRTVTRVEVEQLRRVGSSEAMKSLGIGGLLLPLVAHRIRKRAAAASRNFEPFPGIPGLLRDLADGGVQLALVTSNGRRAVANALGGEIEGMFALRRCGAAAFSKARAFRAIVKEARCRPSDAVVIGDETRDVEAAHEAGVEAIGVEWGFADPGLLRSTIPGRTVADPDALRTLLLNG